MEREFDGYRVRPSSPELRLAFDGSSPIGHEPQPIHQRRRQRRERAARRGAAVHQPRERHRAQPRARRAYRDAALEGMLEVAFALIARAAA